MILVDTSVWIRFLSNREPYASGLDDVLGKDEVAGHEMVFGELLIGDKGNRKTFLASYGQMHQAATVPHSEVVAFAQARRLQGRGAGWIDIHLLASAMVGRYKLWTADPRFAVLAEEFDIAYAPP
ncbi:MAG TPA: PIN domain-containing protein [Polyangia bacterium]|nr:PIN domain-containing protein [Polyangia bacterium]